MTNKTLNSKVVRAGAILSALLMVLLPSTGVGNFASVAYAVSNDQDTSLSTFTVDGTNVTDGAVVDVAFGTSSVDVVATPTNADALVEVTGDTGLEAGANTVSVLVTAADDVTTQTYSVTVNVAKNNDTSLAVFSVNGDDVVDGGSVNLAYGTTEVDVVAEATDVEATVVISGDANLDTGANTLQVVVTADDGTTTQTYSVTLNVAENDDASLAVFAVNGNDVVDGGTVNLDYGTTEVDVVAEATDAEAVLVVTGGSGLTPGANTLTVQVTAADGVSTQTYTVTLQVALNDDTSLAVFAINGDDVTNGATVTVANGTTSVTVVAESTDENASVVITGRTGLVTGNNTLTVEVTAANGVATATYTVTIVVSEPPFSNDTSLQTFKVDGTNVVDGASVTIAQGRTSVSVEAVPTNAFATAAIAGNTGLQPGANEVTVTVTADDGTVKVYKVTVTVNVPSSDTSLSSVKVDGNSVTVNADGSTVYDASFGTEEVTVAVVTTSGTATFTVSGEKNLVVGQNTVTIAVEAEDGTAKSYTFKVVVAAANTNTGISSFQVNGTSVSAGDTVDLLFGTTDVTVDVETAAPTSTFSVTGSSGLGAGTSTLTVTVTAQSGATATYSVTLNVLPASSDKTINSITVNGLAVTGNAITLTAGTAEAEVVVNLANAFASYTVSGTNDVSTGENTRTITVTAQDGSTANTVITITVPEASTDNSLASLTVDDVLIAVGDTVEKPFGTSSVNVVAVAGSNKATVVVAGEDVLVPGLNTVTITVTAESGASASYTFKVNVARSSNTDVSSILVNNTEVSVSKAITVPFGSTDVEVSAVTADPDASYVVSGNTSLVSGANDVTVTVTAANGDVKAYVIVVTVPTSDTDNTLASLSVDGAQISVGDTVEKPFGTSAVVVAAVANSNKATVVVAGEDVLVPGLNTVTITVTAESGASASYTFTVNVAKSNNIGLSSILVENQEVKTSMSFTTTLGATEVAVSAVTADPEASYTVSGNTDLQAGSNQVIITVTAADGVTSDQYIVMVTVPVLSTSTALRSVTINGSEVNPAGGWLIETLPYGTTSVEVIAIPDSDKATVVVSGQDQLLPGVNSIFATVTAESGATQTYEYYVSVAKSSDNSLGSILVNGKSVEVGETLIVSGDTTSVVVVALANDADATVTVSGADNLVPGDNTVIVTVTAADNTPQNYSFTVRVPTASTNANLAFFNVNGVDALENASVDVATDVTEAIIIAQTESANASYAIPGGIALAVGANTITVVVTAQDGSTTREYSVTVNRAAPLSGDTSLASLTVDGNVISAGDTVDVDFGTTAVEVVATPTNANATALVSGATGLVSGDNTVSVLVTAENGTTEEFFFTVKVAKSNDNSLTGITVNGSTISLEDLSFTVSSGTDSVVVGATVSDVEASYSVTGQQDLEYGANTVTITVTAANGQTRDYILIVTRTPLSGNNNIGLITVNGTTVEVNGTFEVDPGTTSVEVVATAEDTDASVEVLNTTDLEAGNNVITITVTAANGSEATYTVNVFVKSLSNDTTLKLFTVDGAEVQDGSEVVLDGTKNFVAVIAQANDANAVVSVEGSTDLAFGANDVVVTVTAEDGSVATYTVSVVFPNIGDTSLKTFTVNGNAVDDGERVELEYGVTDVEVVVETTDAEASFEVAGAEGLVSGENELLVTVTARDGETVQEYLVIVFVAFNTDSSLSTFQVNGEDVVDGQEITLPAYTTEVEVSAEATDPDATIEITGATELAVGENLLTVTVTAADGVSATDYVITLIVPLGNNVELSTFTVNGNDAADGDALDLEPYTTSVEVIVETVDPDAVFTVSGDKELVVGANQLVVSVTAADGTTTVTYTVTLNVPLGNNVELSSFQINGNDVADGDTVTVEYGTTEVDVVASAVDADAEVVITGGSDLQPGENTLTVTVTAADGETTATYTVTITVALNTDASLNVFAINGTDVVDGETVELPYGTTSVEIVAEATDPDAEVVIEGGTDLVSGENTLTVTVTAADGETSEVYTLTLMVAFNSDASLAVLQVNGVDVLDGAEVLLDPYTTEAEITAEPTDADATVVIEGGTELVSGENTVTVTVTAADGETVEVYTLTLVVALGNDVTLATFQVNGEDVEDGGSLDLPPLTTSVEVVVETTDPDASYVVSGNDNLVLGANTLTVVVSAADGSGSATYTVTLNIPLNDDTTLATLKVNGVDTADGETVEVEYGTTEVPVVVVTNDPLATFEISGGTGVQVVEGVTLLGVVAGENTLTVTVTAQDSSTAEYTVTVTVMPNTDTSLATFQVNGEDVINGDVIDLVYGTAEVEVVALATDPEAAVEIAGNTDLVSGENTLTVTVTAADGETVEEYIVTLNVAFNSDSSLASFQINGEDVVDGAIVTVEPYTTSVEVTAEPTDPDATVEIVGAEELVNGENLITVSVTAADGSGTDYVVTVIVPLGNDVTLSTFQVNGEDVEDGASLTLPALTTSVEVSVETTDPEATYEIVGAEGLNVGENTLSVIVYPADGTASTTYTVTLKVLNNDTSLATFTVDGADVIDGETIELAYGTASVEVVAVPTDENATAEIEGGTDLASGENTVTVTVTAEDGETIEVFTVILNVAFNDDASLGVFQVNGVDVTDGEIVDLPPYTTEVEVTAEGTDPDATVEIEGGTELVSGENSLTVTVTAANQTTVEVYTITLLVALGNDVTLSAFQVNGEDVEDGATINVPALTTSVEVSVELTDPDASYEVIGNQNLELGSNVVTVVVTAADNSTTATYTVTVFVPSNDTSLAELSVNGSPVDSGDYVELPLGTTSVDVVVVTNDEGATFEVEGGSDLQPGENSLIVTVTAADGETTAEYTVTLFVLLSDDTSLATFTITSGDLVFEVEDGSDVELPPYTTDVSVEAVATNADAQVEVSGADALQPGANEIQVTVTAADGETIKVYTVFVNVLISTETGVSEIIVNGTTAIDGDVVLSTDLELTEVDVEVTLVDENAAFEVTGNTDLVKGDNLITITVTAQSGDVAEYKVIFRLGGLPGNAKLKSLIVAGNTINLTAVEPSITVPAGTRTVSVIPSAEDESASIKVTGNTDLVVGENTVKVTVTATDGKTVREYLVKVNVQALSSNTNIGVIRVNGVSVASGDRVTLVPGAKFAEVTATAQDSAATISYSGTKNLVAGDNTATITVRAANGATATYTVVLVVPALSSDTSLKTFSIEGFNMLNKTRLSVPAGTAKLRITAQANSAGASVSIAGREIKAGINFVVVTVTAADGTVATYTVRVKA